jgi:hypothetical protein
MLVQLTNLRLLVTYALRLLVAPPFTTARLHATSHTICLNLTDES